MTGRRKPCLLLTTLCAMLVVSAGGCAQRWTFAPPGELRRLGTASVEAPPRTFREAERRPAVAEHDRVDGYQARSGETSVASSDGQVVPTSCQQREGTTLAAAALGGFGVGPRGAVRPIFVERLPPVAPLGDAFFDEAHATAAYDELDCAWMPRPFAKPYRVFRRGECAFVAWTDCVHPRLPEGLTELRWKALRDQWNLYRWPSSADLLLGIAGASLLANTSMDQDFRDWVQEDVRSHDTDRFADFWKAFGEGQIFVPSLAVLGVTGWLLEDCPVWDVAGHYGWRTTRAYLVGVPPAVFLQWALGSSRPGEKWYESSWRLFADKNGVSGHAFIGAVPFITAGDMCENPYVAGCFYFMSFLPAWSRINDDSHYLSQSALGWWIAYLACRSVEQTEADCPGRCFRVMPMCGPEVAGVTGVWAY